MALQRGVQNPYDVLVEVENKVRQAHPVHHNRQHQMDIQLGLSFLAGRVVCITPLDEVTEIIRIPQVVKISHSKPYIYGIASFRGEIFTVCDLSMFLSQHKQNPTRQSRMLILKYFEEWIGFIVDRVFGLYRIPQEMVNKTKRIPLEGMNPYLQGVLQNQHAEIPILSLKKIINSVDFGNKLLNNEGTNEIS